VYVLDTNTLIYFFKGKGRVAERMIAETPANIGIPAIVVYELETGIAKSASPLTRTRQLKALLGAAANQAILVSHNLAEFSRVGGLNTEDWYIS
jgi:tRNA(fMet)-specific endonuclease VapC